MPKEHLTACGLRLIQTSSLGTEVAQSVKRLRYELPGLGLKFLHRQDILFS